MWHPPSPRNGFSLPMRDGNKELVKSILDEKLVLAYLWGMETQFPQAVVASRKSFSLPMRDGNQEMEEIAREIAKSFSLPMRDGNVGGRCVSRGKRTSFSLPMRDGNIGSLCSMPSKNSVLAYLWGMETRTTGKTRGTLVSFSLPMRDGNDEVLDNEAIRHLF